MRIRIAPVAAAAALFLAGCGPKPGSVHVSPAKATIYGLKRTAPIVAEVLDKKGKPMNGPLLAWDSSKPNVASVDNGLVKSVGAGKSVVTVAVSNTKLSATAVIEVVDVESVTLTPSRSTLAGPKGSTMSFATVVKDSKGALLTLQPKWTSSDPKVAMVTADGVVHSVGEGKTIITAAFADVAGTGELLVSFREIASFEASPKTLLVKVGETQFVNAIAKDPSGAPIDNAATVWTSSDPKTVAVVNGAVTGVAPGTATVRVVCGTMSAEVSVIVS